jgi:hypothetical protein
MVKGNGLALEFAAKDLSRDREIVLAAVAEDGMALQYADCSLKNDRDIVMTALANNAMALQYADETLRNDKDLVKYAICKGRRAFQFASQILRENKEFVLQLIQEGYYSVLSFAADSLRSDPQFIMEAVRINFMAIYGASPSLLKDESFYLGFLREIIPDKKAYQYYALAYQKYGLQFPQRFACLKYLRQAMQTLDQLQTGEFRRQHHKPLALVITPKDDWNGAFETNPAEWLMAKGYQVVYLEAGMDTVAEVLKTINPNGEPIVWSIGGHGTQQKISLGGDDPAYGQNQDESIMFDFSDREQLAALSPCIGEGSFIILQSCSTGKGGSTAENMVNFFSAIYPQASVNGPIIPTNLKALHFHRKKLTEVEFNAPGASYLVGASAEKK